MLAQQEVKAVQRGLAAVARVFDAVHAVKVSVEPDGSQHLLHVVPRRVREHELGAPQKAQRMLQRVLVHHHLGELGEDVRLPQKMARIGAAHVAMRDRVKPVRQQCPLRLTRTSWPALG